MVILYDEVTAVVNIRYETVEIKCIMNVDRNIPVGWNLTDGINGSRVCYDPLLVSKEPEAMKYEGLTEILQ